MPKFTSNSLLGLIEQLRNPVMEAIKKRNFTFLGEAGKSLIKRKTRMRFQREYDDFKTLTIMHMGVERAAQYEPHVIRKAFNETLDLAAAAASNFVSVDSNGSLVADVAVNIRSEAIRSARSVGIGKEVPNLVGMNLLSIDHSNDGSKIFNVTP